MVTLVKVEGTLDELRALFLEGVKQEARKQAKKAGGDVVKAGAKATKKRAKSAWQKYVANKKNQIKFKSGPNKGKLDFAKMSRAFKRSRRK